MGNWALKAVEASEVAEAAEVNEAGEVSKAWKITPVDFRVFQVLEFNNFRTNAYSNCVQFFFEHIQIFLTVVKSDILPYKFAYLSMVKNI